MKKRMAGALSLVGLIGAYLVLRYPLLFLHNMKEWPVVLFAVGAIIVIISGLAFCKRILPVLTVSGYIVGFILGYIFQFDYGTGLNNLWIIWTCVYSGVVLVGVAVEVFYWRRKTS